MAEHLTIPGALEWDTVERHSIATLRYAGGKEHDVKYVSEVAYDSARRLAEELTAQSNLNKLMMDASCGEIELLQQLLRDTSSALDMIADNTDDHDAAEICRERIRLIDEALKP